MENVRKIKIVADSSSDTEVLEGVAFASAPLKIVTANCEYIDDSSLDTSRMVNELSEYRGRSSTSCPNVADWLTAFGDADEIFCVTITSALSGSYNSALAAAAEYRASHPSAKVFVFDSKSTGPEMALIIEHIRDEIKLDKSFESIVESTNHYMKKTGLFFILESLNNLANNGRVKPIVAKMAGLLGIRLLGKASDGGELEPLDKCFGERRAHEALIKRLKSLGFVSGKIKITHCLAESSAKRLADLLLAAFNGVKVKISECRGLCSFYAERGGLLIGYEMA